MAKYTQRALPQKSRRDKLRSRRYSATQRQSIIYTHNMLNTSSKNYASIGRKIRSFTPSSSKLPSSNTVLGKHTVELMNVLCRKNNHKRSSKTSNMLSMSQSGGGQFVRLQKERQMCIDVLKHV